jgi:hypothetical protein
MAVFGSASFSSLSPFICYEKTTLRNIWGRIKFKLNMKEFGGIKRIIKNQRNNMDV